MTRFDLFRVHQIQDGIIRSKGEFEGQALYVPYFWSKYLSGEASEVGADVVQFSVKDSDRVQFPELGNRQVVRLRFVKSKIEEA